MRYQDLNEDQRYDFSKVFYGNVDFDDTKDGNPYPWGYPWLWCNDEFDFTSIVELVHEFIDEYQAEWERLVNPCKALNECLRTLLRNDPHFESNEWRNPYDNITYTTEDLIDICKSNSGIKHYNLDSDNLIYTKGNMGMGIYQIINYKIPYNGCLFYDITERDFE